MKLVNPYQDFYGILILEVDWYLIVAVSKFFYLLDKEHTTAPQLTAEFEVSPRTIYRDVELLISVGIPIYAEPVRNGGIYLLQDFILDRAILSENEKQEILTVIQSMSPTGYPNGKEMLTK